METKKKIQEYVRALFGYKCMEHNFDGKKIKNKIKNIPQTHT